MGIFDFPVAKKHDQWIVREKTRVRFNARGFHRQMERLDLATATVELCLTVFYFFFL